MLTRIVQELDLHGADLFGRVADQDERAVVRAADADGVPTTFGASTVSDRQVIAVVLGGAVEARVGDELIALRAGDTLIIPPHVPHALRRHRRAVDAHRAARIASPAA